MPASYNDVVTRLERAWQDMDAVSTARCIRSSRVYTSTRSRLARAISDAVYLRDSGASLSDRQRSNLNEIITTAQRSLAGALRPPICSGTGGTRRTSRSRGGSSRMSVDTGGTRTAAERWTPWDTGGGGGSKPAPSGSSGWSWTQPLTNVVYRLAPSRYRREPAPPPSSEAAPAGVEEREADRGDEGRGGQRELDLRNDVRVSGGRRDFGSDIMKFSLIGGGVLFVSLLIYKAVQVHEENAKKG